MDEKTSWHWFTEGPQLMIYTSTILRRCQRLTAWTTFILDKLQGFTQTRVERLNDSTCTYVWVILGAQNQQPRTGTEFDAQKQFPANVDDVITPLHQSSSIKTLYRTPVPWWTLDLARCIYGTQWHAAVHDLTPYWRLQWDCDRRRRAAAHD